MTDGRVQAVITGIGVVAPNGSTREAYWQGLMEGRNGVGRVTRFDVDRFASHMAAEVTEFTPPALIPEEHIRHMDRAFLLGVTAAAEAVKDSGLDFAREDTATVGVYMGLAVAGVESGEKGFHAIRDRGPYALSRNLYQAWFPSACSGYISLLFGLHGPSHVFSTGCTSSMDSIGAALEAMRLGQDDIVIAGGSEAPITPMPFNSFCAMRALSQRNTDVAHACRPFDRERDGFVLGEGSAVLVIEKLEHARARGAHIYAELAGYGTTANAFHMTAPDPAADQSARALRLALDDGETLPEAVDYFCAHGSSTPLNEKAETRAIKMVFGDHARRLMVSSVKSMIGHTLGSAGAMEVAACAMAIERHAVPPTINYEVPDPECDLDIVPNVARDSDVRVAMANGAGFCGKNSATVLVAV